MRWGLTSSPESFHVKMSETERGYTCLKSALAITPVCVCEGREGTEVFDTGTILPKQGRIAGICTCWRANATSPSAPPPHPSPTPQPPQRSPLWPNLHSFNNGALRVSQATPAHATVLSFGHPTPPHPPPPYPTHTVGMQIPLGPLCQLVQPLLL